MHLRIAAGCAALREGVSYRILQQAVQHCTRQWTKAIWEAVQHWFAIVTNSFKVCQSKYGVVNHILDICRLHANLFLCAAKRLRFCSRMGLQAIWDFSFSDWLTAMRFSCSSLDSYSRRQFVRISSTSCGNNFRSDCSFSLQFLSQSRRRSHKVKTVLMLSLILSEWSCGNIATFAR